MADINWQLILAIIVGLIFLIFVTDALWMAWVRRQHKTSVSSSDDATHEPTNEELGLSSVRKVVLSENSTPETKPGPQLEAKRRSSKKDETSAPASPKSSAPKKPTKTPAQPDKPEPATKPQTSQTPQTDVEPEPTIDESIVIQSRPAAASLVTIEKQNLRTSAVDSADKSLQVSSAAKDILVIYVITKRIGQKTVFFPGSELLQTILSTGMRYGDMGIFHRYAQAEHQDKILFSLASAYEPGTFDIEHMDKVPLRGLTLFLSLPCFGNPLRNFELMLEVANRIAQTFGAEIRDDQQSVFTLQTAEYYRERIREYTRKYLPMSG